LDPLSPNSGGDDGMAGHIALPLLKLTRRVTDQLVKPKPIVSIVPAVDGMAEQEEDFSSLPLPDRFQHKVHWSPRIVLSKRTNRTSGMES
jgi:hypothetical protein